MRVLQQLARLARGPSPRAIALVCFIAGFRCNILIAKILVLQDNDTNGRGVFMDLVCQRSRRCVRCQAGAKPDVSSSPHKKCDLHG